MNKGGIFIALFVAVLSISVVLADSCDIKVNSKTTKELISEIPSIDSQLKACSPDIPSPMNKLLKNGNFLIDISDDSDMYMTINNGKITGLVSGTPNGYAYKIIISSCQLTNILNSNNKVGAFSSYYLSGGAKVIGGGIINKVKLFFVKLFGKSAIKNSAIPVGDCSQIGAGKPENCNDANMQGAEEYQYAKVEWDRRLKETGHICQTQTAERPKGGDCVYLFEQIKNNDKKWLCWYK